MESGRELTAYRSVVGDGDDVFATTSRCGQTGLVAPVFRNFAGSGREPEYLSVLAKYYDAVAACGHGRISVDDVAGDGDADVVRGRREWWRQCGFGVGGRGSRKSGGASAGEDGCESGSGVANAGSCGGVVGGAVVSDGAGSTGGGVDIRRPVVVPVSRAGAGGDKYVPPHARGKHYASNRAAKERRKARKVQVEECSRGSSFAACSQEQREGLQKTRALRLMAENKLKTAEAELKFARLQAEREFALKDVDSGAYVNRIQMRNEALDKKWQDQAENVQSYRRTGPVQGWVKTVVSGEGSGPSSPRSVPTLSSGGSPRSESDWELEIKRRDDENAQLRLELRALIAENDGVYSCGDYDSRNFNQVEHYGSTDDGAEKAVPWDQDSQLLRLREQVREPMFRSL